MAAHRRRGRRVRRRAVYIAGFGVGSALGWFLLVYVVIPAIVSGEPRPQVIPLAAALAVVWAIAAAVATMPLRARTARAVGSAAA